MFNLAPRFDKIRTATPSNVSPDTYIICSGNDNLKNWAPFLSSSVRKTGSSAACSTQALYHPEENRAIRVKGGASINYTAKRLKYSKDDLPGPANYDAKLPEKGCKCSPRPPGRGRLYVCRVPFTTFTSAPSVPTHIDENGYDIDEMGALEKIPMTEHDTSLGPAFYSVPRREINTTTGLYHSGSRWSKSNAVRFKKLQSNTPGVGEYDLNVGQCCQNPNLEEYRELARLFSFLPRFTEGEILKALRENLPAPNQYDVKNSSFEVKKPCGIVPRPFVVGAKRFNYVATDTPSPAEYVISADRNGKASSRKNVPFSIGTDRWKTTKSTESPSPNTYTLIGSIEEALRRKINKYSVVRTPFCSTAQRKMDFIPKNENPGPSDYDLENTGVCRLLGHGSCFKSKSSRFKYSSSEDVGPASYDITVPFKKNTSRKSHNTGKVPFQSKAQRYKETKLQTPGPADYNGREAMGSKGLSFGREARFKDIGNDNPAPGAYTMHPSVGLSVYKGIATNNIRLKENVMRTKLRLPPGATWANWHEEVKKKKKLRWFAKPTAEYQHCIGTI